MTVYTEKRISVCSQENKIKKATFSHWDMLEFKEIYNKWHKEISFINDCWMKDKMKMQL